MFERRSLVLTAMVLLASFSSRPATAQTGPVAAYSFDEAAGNAVADASGNEPDAVFQDLYFLRDADAHEDLTGDGSAATVPRAPARHCGRVTRRSPLAKV